MTHLKDKKFNYHNFGENSKNDKIEFPKLRISEGKILVSKMVTIFLEDGEAEEDMKNV